MYGADFHEPTIEGDAQLIEADVCSVGTSACRHQHLFNGVLFDFALLCLKGDLDPTVFDLSAFELRLRVDFDSLFGENAFQFLRDFFVFERNDARQHFDERDFRAEAAVDGGELHTDGAATDDQHRFRNVFQVKHANVAEDVLFIEAVTGQGLCFRTGCDDDVLRVYLGRSTIGLHRDFRGADHGAGALDDGDLVLSKQKVDAFRHLVDDVAFAFLDFVKSIPISPVLNRPCCEARLIS